MNKSALDNNNMADIKPGPSRSPMDMDIQEPNDSKRLCTSKKTYRKQVFREAWLRDSCFSSWLAKCEGDPHKARCNLCKVNITAGKSELLRHSRSSFHISNTNYASNSEGEEKNDNKELSQRIFDNDIKKAEVRIVLDLVEHCQSFHSFKHSVEMLQVLPDSEIVKCISLKRTKISAIVKNVINRAIVEKNIGILKDNIFSILLGEATDISESKNLFILIKYLHLGKVNYYLLDFVRLKNSTTQNLYKCLEHSLSRHNLAISNIVGICTDNANVMLRSQNSLISRLLQVNGEVAVFSCICHNIHLIACNACENLPDYVENLLHSVHSYLSRSPKRQSMLEATQHFMSQQNKKIEYSSRTKWLALYECVDHVLNLWSVLYAIFEEATMEKDSPDATKIFHYLNDPFIKAYLQFLHYVLNIFHLFKTHFQSSKVLVHSLVPEGLKFLRRLGSNFLKHDLLKSENIFEIDVLDENNLLRLNLIFIGYDAKQTIDEIGNNATEETATKIEAFYSNCQKYYQQVFQDTVKRIPFKDPFLNSLEFLSPNVTLDITKHKNQLDCVLEKFSSKFNISAAQNEWHLITSHFTKSEEEYLSELDPCEFWEKISNIEEGGKKVYENIGKVANLCLTLPHSNAEVEKFLSLVNEIKTNDRNRLTPSMVAALTRIRLDLRNTNTNCSNYIIDDNVLQYFNKEMYKSERIPKHLNGILSGDDTSESNSDTY